MRLSFSRRLFVCLFAVVIVSGVVAFVMFSLGTPAEAQANSALAMSNAKPVPKALSAGGSTGNSSWLWQNPLPQGNPLLGVICPGLSTCFAVGTSGTIIGTTNGGNTWSLQYSGTPNNLNGISCATVSICYAVGDAGTILKTSDGGNNWVAQTSGTTQQLNGVSCVSNTGCYAAGGTNSLILITNDGGSHWTTSYSSASGKLYAINCINGGVCVAAGAGGVVVNTTNSGNSWNNQTLLPNGNGDFGSVSCPSSAVCTVAGSRGYLKTTDGATTWSGGSNNYNELNLNCPTVNLCYVVTSIEIDAGVGNFQTVIYIDNGQIGPPYSPSSGATRQLHAISCFSATSCIAVGGNYKFANNPTMAILATTNGGRTWKPQGYGTPDTFYGVSCLSSSNNCFAVGSRGKLFATGAEGTLWADKSSGVSTALYGINCFSSTSCLAVGEAGKIIATGNAGNTWTSQNSGTTNDLFGISCLNSGTCLAVGAGGTILNSTDGGNNWTSQSSGTTALLNGVSCFDASTCYVVGMGGMILKTVNGGGNWSLQTPPNYNFYGVACVTALHCFAVAGSNYMYNTTDGGITWNLQNNNPYPGITQSLYGVTCLDANTCYAVGSEPFYRSYLNTNSIYVTTNGGAAWDIRAIDKSAPTLFGVACSSATYCLAVGGGEALEALINGSTAWTFNWSEGTGAISCPTSINCYTVGDKNKILATSDGGNTWNSSYASYFSNTRGIDCLSATTCYAVGAKADPSLISMVVKTVDGGQTWALQNSNAVTTTLTAISCANPNTCVAVGVQGKIIATTDGGQTWNAQTSGVGVDLSDIKCPDTSNCYAVGSSSGSGFSFVVTTVNSGQTWTWKLVSGITLRGISCPSVTVCYAVGYNLPNSSPFASTKDGGQTWIASTSISGYPFSTVSCTSISVCYAVGDADGIYITNDGGTTWNKQDIGSKNHFYGISCWTNCVVAGSGGSILANGLIVTSPTDEGLPGAVGKLSYAMNKAAAGQTIGFNVPGGTITLNSALKPLKAGVNLVASCAAPVTIDAARVAGAKLTLSGKNVVQGLHWINLNGSNAGIQATGKGNLLHCVKVQH